MYIKKIKFIDDSVMDLKTNSIIVFVGPNNSGKTTALKNLYSFLESGKIVNTLILKQCEISKSSDDEITKYMEATCEVFYRNGEKFFNTYNFSSYESSLTIQENLCKFFVCKIDTTERIMFSDPQMKKAYQENPSHPLQLLIESNHLSERKSLENSFKKVFNEPLCIDDINTSQIVFKLGELSNATTTVNEGVDKAKVEYDSMLPLKEQGDGMRSFTSLAVNLVYSRYSIFIIDEPEAFMHQPQAYDMAKSISMLSKDKQVFIATHSIELIKGLLDYDSSRVKIVKINRLKEKSSFNIIENNSIHEINKDPLLKYSNILDSIFYKRLIICESDADCYFYKMIKDYEERRLGITSNDLFIYSHGKDRITKIIKSLKSLNICILCIFDFDVLNTKTDIENICKICSIEWSEIQSDYDEMINYINEIKVLKNSKSLKQDIDEIFERRKKDNINRIVDNVKKILNYENPWNEIKEKGISYFDSNKTVKNKVEKIMAKFQSKGIHIVSLGELENFVNIGNDNHGQKWLSDVLAKYPDLSCSCYNDAKKFISSFLEFELK